MKFPAIYGICVGFLMLAQWAFFLAAGQVPEVQTEPVRLAFHLVAEFITAVGLVISGVGLLRGARPAKAAYTVCAGMLMYSVIVSPGYFAQQGQWVFVAMFGALLLLAAGSLIWLHRGERYMNR